MTDGELLAAADCEGWRHFQSQMSHSLPHNALCSIEIDDRASLTKAYIPTFWITDPVKIEKTAWLSVCQESAEVQHISQQQSPINRKPS